VVLRDAAPPAVVAIPPVTTFADGERRHLTVLFCDLVGSTEIAARLDPEEWREVVAGYHRAAAQAITRFGGHVAKYLGDGVMAYFGWPEATITTANAPCAPASRFSMLSPNSMSQVAQAKACATKEQKKRSGNRLFQPGLAQIGDADAALELASKIIAVGSHPGGELGINPQNFRDLGSCGLVLSGFNVVNCQKNVGINPIRIISHTIL